MRLWSLHPKYLDARGLTACWREGLLARQVLLGNTKGYRHHPQLERFRKSGDPVMTINAYLNAICDEAERRGYRFDRSRVDVHTDITTQIPVTMGQLEFERQHLLQKLEQRSPHLTCILENTPVLQPHPLFYPIEGKAEHWER